MDDHAIIELYWQRSQAAISETAAKYGGFCKKIAMNILHSYEDCEECVNDTYLNVWNSVPPERPTAFAAFLGKITRNLSFNRYKRLHAQKRGAGEVPLLLGELSECVRSSENVEGDFDGMVAAEVIEKFLRSLDVQKRVVFVKRYWFAQDIRTIAQEMNISESKVKSMLFRLRQKLKICLESEGVLV